MHHVRNVGNQNWKCQQLTINLTGINCKSLSNCLKHAVKISCCKLVLKINIPLSLMKIILRKKIVAVTFCTVAGIIRNLNVDI